MIHFLRFLWLRYNDHCLQLKSILSGFWVWWRSGNVLCRCRKSLLQDKVVFMKFDQSLFPHFSQLFGERAAVKIQVVSHLLSVKGDCKLSASGPDRLKWKIGKKSSSHCFRSGAENTITQRQIFLKGNQKEVAIQFYIPYRFLIFLPKQGIGINQKDLRIIGTGYIHHQWLMAQRVGFGKRLSRRYILKDCFTSP